MPNLDETAWTRGVADAKRWRGMLRWQVAAFVLAIAAGVTANWAGVPPLWSAGIGAGSGILLLAVQVVAGVLVAPYRQRDEARDVLREQQGGKVNRRLGLTDLFARGSALYSERITREGYDDWKVRLKTWTQGTASFLWLHYGPTEREMFMRPPPSNAADVLGSVSAAHSAERLHLSARIFVLRRILEETTQ